MVQKGSIPKTNVTLSTSSATIVIKRDTYLKCAKVQLQQHFQILHAVVLLVKTEPVTRLQRLLHPHPEVAAASYTPSLHSNVAHSALVQQRPTSDTSLKAAQRSHDVSHQRTSCDLANNFSESVNVDQYSFDVLINVNDIICPHSNLPFYVVCGVNQIPVHFELDSDASVSTIS